MTPHRLLITGAAAEAEHIHGDENDISEQWQGGIFVNSAYVGGLWGVKGI